MRDRVKTAFCLDWLLILRQQSCRDRDICWYHIFIEKFAYKNQPFGSLHRMHVDDSNARRFNILGSPIVANGAVNYVPAQIVHRDHLRWNNSLLLNRPFHTPLAAVPHYVQFPLV